MPGIYTRHAAMVVFRIKILFLPTIEYILINSSKRVFTKLELLDLLPAHALSSTRQLPTDPDTFIQLLVKQKILTLKKILKDGEPVELLCYGNPSIYEIAASFYKNAYISHGTAAFIHQLLPESISVTYITVEQLPKTKQAISLDQDAINRAFAKPQRQSANESTIEGRSVLMLNGMYTDRKGIQEADGKLSFFALTSPERTLLDLTVRPAYAGGAFSVLNAYRNALQLKLSFDKLIQLYEALSFVYPYHQAIGFYLEKAGYRGKLLNYLQKKPMTYNFYLDYELKERAYSLTWKVFYPAFLQ